MNKKIALGIDIGGTNIKLGIIDHAGRIIARSRLVTKAFVSHPTQLIQALADAAALLIQKNTKGAHAIKGIGIGLPGLVDPCGGVVIFLPNVPGWKNIFLRKKLEALLGIPVFLDNDVNVITLAEWRFGAGIGADHMIGMTLGTGVGAGLILNGALYRGPGFAAGELGHVPINLQGPKCNCPSFACLESYVGNARLQEKAAKVFRRKNISLEEVFALAQAGDQRAVRFWDETGDYIGSALVGIVNVLNPQRIIIGGGVSNNARFLFPAIRRQIRQRAMPVQAKMAKVVRAALGDDAGLIGAGVLVDMGLTT